MKTINGIIKDAKKELEKSNQGTRLVGNRPHYPMLVLYNSAFDQEAFDAISATMGRVWPQSLRYLVNYRYTVPETTICYSTISDNRPQTVEEVGSTIDEAKKAREVFQSMRQWFVYNIIDTSTLAELADFEKHYGCIGTLDEALKDAHKTMLIVLLEDSSAKRQMTQDIRTFLSQHNAYDSTIILSTRARDNSMVDVSELYRIIGDLMILSNNDSVSAVDDEDFKRRTNLLFSQTSYIVSYILRERPNRKIAIQIINTIFNEVVAAINRPVEIDPALWGKKCGFENAKSGLCEAFLNQLELSVPAAAFQHLPMNATAVGAKVDLSRLSYREMRQYIYDDVFSGFVANYCRTQLAQDMDIHQCIRQFRQMVTEQVSSIELARLTDSIIDRCIDQLTPGTANEDVPLAEYFKRCIQVHIRKAYIFPGFKKVLQELRQEAIQKLAEAQQLQSAMQEHIPLLLVEEIGTVYASVTSAFLHSEEGQPYIHRILQAGDRDDAMPEAVFDTFCAVLRANPTLFSLPFLEEWAKRLDLTGDRIYREISTALTENADNMIRLYGNYSIEKRLKVFMLHTGDAAGNTPTVLYEHLQTTFAGDDLVQYFNTGYDDALEALTFIECSGNDLII